MDKRAATVSFRTTDRVEQALAAIAATRDITLSDLMHQMAVREIDDERRRYLKLSAVFGTDNDLLGLSDKSDASV